MTKETSVQSIPTFHCISEMAASSFFPWSAGGLGNEPDGLFRSVPEHNKFNFRVHPRENLVLFRA
jgi:hypothetical protein